MKIKYLASTLNPTTSIRIDRSNLEYSQLKVWEDWKAFELMDDDRQIERIEIPRKNVVTIILREG